MIINIDSREKKNKEILKTFDVFKIKYFVNKSYAGDYYSFKNPKIVIELKKDMLELCNNLTKEHERFKREILRAKNEMDCEVVVLIREPFSSLTEVQRWSSDKTQTSGVTLYKIMKTMSERYGIKWLFCHRESAGIAILELLTKDFSQIIEK